MHILEIQKNIKTTQGVVRLIPEIHTSEGVRVATVSEILESLTLTAPPSFIRSIKEITFGGVNGSDAYIVLNVSSFDIGFAGMLAWEKTLQSDLSVLFNGTQLRGTSFTDTLTSNKNIRLLVDAQGNDVITYAFVNKNTIVITSTRTILDMLIPLVQ
jgi:hypothetical protein